MKAYRSALLSLAMLAIAVLPNQATAESQKQPELLVIYWSSPDCHWCTWWETTSGLKRAFEESPEFKKVVFRTIKKPSLSAQYVQEHYPTDLSWLAQRMASQEESPPKMPPTWSIYIDRNPWFVAGGARRWEREVWPEIKKLVQQYRGE